MHIDIKVVENLLVAWINEREDALKNGEIPTQEKTTTRREIEKCRKALNILREPVRAEIRNGQIVNQQNRQPSQKHEERNENT